MDAASISLPGSAMNRFVWVLLVAAAIASTALAQQPGVPGRVSFCSTAITAAARLICADPDLAARDAKLANQCDDKPVSPIAARPPAHKNINEHQFGRISVSNAVPMSPQR